MYRQVYDPVGSSLGLSALVAAIPLVVLFVLLGGFRLRAHCAPPFQNNNLANNRSHILTGSPKTSFLAIPTSYPGCPPRPREPSTGADCGSRRCR